MKKVIIIIGLGLILTSCGTKAHCDAYSEVELEQTQQTNSTKSV